MKMDHISKIAVCSRSFSQNHILRGELLENYAHVKFNDEGVSLVGDALIDYLSGYDGAIVALEVIDDYVLSRLPMLKFIGKYGVGLDKIDLKSMDSHGISLGWTAGVNAQNVAEYTLAMVLNLLKDIPLSIELASKCEWRQVKGRQLSSMTYGIVGCGYVGKALVKLIKAFGCKILINDIKDMSGFCAENGISQVSLGTLVSQSDVLSVHLSKNKATEGIISKELLLKMKSGSYLINSARGGLVDEVAVRELLDLEHLAGAAFDVLNEEPPLNTNFINHPKVLVTTHIAGSSREAILAMGRAAIKGLKVNARASSFSIFQ